MDIRSALDIVNRGLTPEALAERTAWHGTAHKFDLFDIEKIGTGEGADAYGWGLYLTDTRDVAAYYRRKLSTITLDGKPLASFDEMTQRAVFVLHDHGWDKDEAKYWGSGLEDLIDSIDRGRVEFTGGYVYEVTIPDDANFLLWDAPYNQQPLKVRKALRSMLPRFGSYFNWLIKKNEPGEVFYVCVGNHLRNKERVEYEDYRKLSSEAMLEAGIAGVKYLDGNSRGETNGSYNYVIFDASLIKVVGRHE